MTASAPRIDERLVAAIARFDKPGRPIAETHRDVGRLAGLLGLTRPSYQQVRVLVHELRAGCRPSEVGEILLGIAVRSIPPQRWLEALAR